MNFFYRIIRAEIRATIQYPNLKVFTAFCDTKSMEIKTKVELPRMALDLFLQLRVHVVMRNTYVQPVQLQNQTLSPLFYKKIQRKIIITKNCNKQFKLEIIQTKIVFILG